MSYTPLHVAPGILLKALLQGSFGLMVFGWAQFVMDIQPFIAMAFGDIHLHGLTHTYVGATLIALFSAVTGKYLSQWALRLLSAAAAHGISIRWTVALASAVVGAYSHVILDRLMHTHVELLSALPYSNELLELVAIETIQKFCIYTGVAGAILYLLTSYAIIRGRHGHA